MLFRSEVLIQRALKTKTLEVEVKQLHERLDEKFSFEGIVGNSQKLKDVIDRSASLEMAYNPNDCVELRWGAAAGSQEGSTCRKAAPQAQRAKMQKYRAWFTERRRPPRA